ncbi:MAG TPA: sulfurtransferase TusA family protein [Micromonosporaceae bacterium]|nr:sulfurtransferase TusA family protein [Micromonosporaceae bacterium]
MTNRDGKTVTQLVAALASRDRAGLDEILDHDVRLRALLPSRYVELAGVTEVADEMLGWFSDVPEIAPLRTDVDTVGDRWRASFRFALRGGSIERVVEQHWYCDVADGKITNLRLTCSGFRPVTDGSTTPAATESPVADQRLADSPVADQRIDALGDSCATLTPRIAAAIRQMAAGEVLGVLTDDPTAADDIAAWTRLTGHHVVASQAEGGGTRFFVRRS